jgi:uroporphyrinogen-III synthase
LLGNEDLIGPSLKGKRIVVTRARSRASSLVAALTELGAEVIELPTIETVPLESYEALDAALGNIAQYQWLIVTSANTVRVLAERLAALNLPPSVLAPPHKVAIGSATARAMREQGIEVDVVPEQYVAESLLAAMDNATKRPKRNEYPSDNFSEAGHSDDQREEESLRFPKNDQSNRSLPQSSTPIHTNISGSRILLARATIARDTIPQELTRGGAIVDVIDAYKTVVPEGAADRIREVFSDASRLPHAATFTSSSTVRNFFALWREAGFAGIPEGVAALSIGPITSETLREFSWEPACEATRHDVGGLVEAVSERFAGNDCGA